MKKGTLSNIILIIVFLAGLSLLLYPTVSDYWNSLHQSRAVAQYTQQVANMDDDRYAELWDAARLHNESLLTRENRYRITEEEQAEYEALLNVTGNGVIGYIDIPAIDCSLPIYHGVSEGVLQIAVGHIEWSSLPVGGEGSHCVLSGHRGLPSAKLFTNLDKLRERDTFLLQVLDETLTYEVDQIRIVEPQEIDELRIEPGKDYCTLVTCTPYGINTHRLLVRGHRIETQAAARTVRVTADAVQIEPVIVAPLVAVPMLLILLFVLLVSTRRRR